MRRTRRMIRQGVNAALKQATRFRLGVAERAREVGKIAKLRPITNPNMASDLTVGDGAGAGGGDGGAGECGDQFGVDYG